MPDVAEGLVMEASLRNFVTRELQSIRKELSVTSQKGKQTFTKMSTQTKGFSKFLNNARSGLVSFATRFGPAAIAVAGLTMAVRKLGEAYSFTKEKSQDFEQSLSRIEAILVPTSNEFAHLTDRALKLGETTVFSASQVGESFKEMGKLGMSANQIIDASAGVLDLAAAAEVGMGEAAKISVAALNQFGLAANESTRVVDVMTKSFNTSALDITKFSEAMKMAGPIAGSTGTSIEETTALLAVLADRGIDASMAGTAMRRIMLELTDTNSKASKAIRGLVPDTASLTEKMRALHDAGMGATTATEFFSLRGTVAAQIIANNTEEVEKLTKTYENADGTARHMAETMLDNTAGATIILKSAQEGLAIAIGEAFGPERRKNIDLYTAMVRKATTWVRAHSDELRIIAMNLGEVWRIAVKSIGIVGRAVGFVFTTISTLFSEVQYIVWKSAHEILNAVNWVSNKLGKGDVIDLGPMEELIEGAADRVGRGIQNMLNAFTGKDYVAAQKNIDALKSSLDRVGKAAPITDDELSGEEDKEAKKAREKAFKEQDEMMRGMIAARDRWEQENADLLKSARERQEDIAIAAIRNAAEREREELLAKQRRELEDYESHGKAKGEIIKVHAEELDAFDARMAEMAENRRKKAVHSAIQAAEQLLGVLIKDKEARKAILTTIAVAEGAASAVTAAKSGWDTGITYYDKAALAIAGAAQAALIAGAEIATIQSAAKGTDFIASGDQLLRVGDNPAKRERVQVTPLDGPGTIGAQQTSTNSVTIAPVFNVSGNLDRAAADSIILRMQDMMTNIREAQFIGISA